MSDETFFVIDGSTGEASEHQGGFEEMFDLMRKAEDEANKLVTDMHRVIGTEGHQYWASLHGELLIFGKAWTLDEYVSSEMKYHDDEEDGPRDQHEASIREHGEDQRARGYRFGRAYSVACSEGELGSTHISAMFEITEAEFKAASAKGWHWPDLLATAINKTMEDAGALTADPHCTLVNKVSEQALRLLSQRGQRHG